MPLFHQHTLAPMLEAATALIQAHCDAQGELQVVGYYHGNELLADHTVHAVASKIANKIQVVLSFHDYSSMYECVTLAVKLQWSGVLVADRQ